MSERTLVRLAWITWAIAIALVVAGVGMLLTMRYGFPSLPSGSYSGQTTIIPSVYATLGLVVATRRPRHPVGWLLMGCGLAASIQGTVNQYASLAEAADLPGRVHGLWAFSLAQRAWFGLSVNSGRMSRSKLGTAVASLAGGSAARAGRSASGFRVAASGGPSGAANAASRCRTPASTSGAPAVSPSHTSANSNSRSCRITRAAGSCGARGLRW